MTWSLIFFLNIVGVIAFAISGAALAIEKEMDIFGVNILAVTAALGGGLTRDVIIDVAPPAIFQSPLLVTTAVIVANVCFVAAYLHMKRWNKHRILGERTILWIDTLGLAAFVVDGVSACMNTVYKENTFLVVFVGVITGVGGGVLRDVFANRLPQIFVKHIYASAALIGALLTTYLWNITSENIAMATGFMAIVVIRFLAVRYNLNLPKITNEGRS